MNPRTFSIAFALVMIALTTYYVVAFTGGEFEKPELEKTGRTVAH